MTDKDTIIAAQEAEILRLQQALNDIKEYLETGCEIAEHSDYGLALSDALSELNRITEASSD